VSQDSGEPTAPRFLVGESAEGGGGAGEIGKSGGIPGGAGKFLGRDWEHPIFFGGFLCLSGFLWVCGFFVGVFGFVWCVCSSCAGAGGRETLCENCDFHPVLLMSLVTVDIIFSSLSPFYYTKMVALHGVFCHAFFFINSVKL
jgi:hypothetical protein